MAPLSDFLGALGGMVSADGGRFERNFDLQADDGGKIDLETEIEAPISGTLVGYSVELQTGKAGREHVTRLTVRDVSDRGMVLRIGPVPLVDFVEYAQHLTYRVKGGNRYLVHLEAEGFEPGEMVSGLAAARLRLG
jgi:hypothetical protein